MYSLCVHGFADKRTTACAVGRLRGVRTAETLRTIRYSAKKGLCRDFAKTLLRTFDKNYFSASPS